MNFIINPFYNDSTEVALSTIHNGITRARNLISALQLSDNKTVNEMARLIGEGNEAKGKVYSILDTPFCLKISKLGTHVGRNQILQFELNRQCREAIRNKRPFPNDTSSLAYHKRVTIEGEYYALEATPQVAVAVDDTNAYTLMIRHDNTVRLWDEQNTPFQDKDNWPVIDRIKAIMRAYGKKEFLRSMDINGNNILVDYTNKILYLIDPYVPE